MAERVAIVGAGIIGLLIAVRLRQIGYSTIVFDRNHPGSGASRAALGSLTPYSDHEASGKTRKLAEESLRIYPKVVAEISDLSGQSVDFDENGTIEVAFTEGESFRARETYDTMSADGLPVAWVDQASLRQREPNVDEKATCGILYQTESIVDVDQLFMCIDSVARKLGCTIASSVAVHMIKSIEHKGVELFTSTGTTVADHAIIAPGADYASIEGLPRLAIHRICGEVLEAIGPPNHVTASLYCGDGFITPRRDGRVLLGSNYELHQLGMDERPNSISVRTAIRNLSATTRIVPGILGFQLRRTWKAWRPCTDDRQPVVARVRGTNIILAVGFYGLGITLAPIIAQLITGVIAGKDKEIPSEFSYERFSAAR